MRKTVAIDIETTGLYPIPGKSKIFCISINHGADNIEVLTDIRKVKTLLQDSNYTKVIHNAIFDSYWIRRLYDIEVKNIWDTRLMEQVIIGETLPRSNKDEELRKQLSSSLLYTLARYKLVKLKDKQLGAEFATRDIDLPLTQRELEYAKNDVKYLLKLQLQQNLKLHHLDLVRVAELENQTVEVLVDIQNRGIGFDKDYWLKLAKANEATYNKLLKKLPKEVENWNSSKQVCSYFQSQGIPLDSLTKAEELQKEYNHPVLNNFIEARALYKAVTTYGASWLEDKFKSHRGEPGYTIDADGRVRTSYEQILNTGRLASANPNLQQLPRDGKYRGAFVPRPGYAFVDCDFPSQEIAIAAAASGEARWIDAILAGEDIHMLTASTSIPEGTPDARQIGKTTNFTILYGGGPYNIALKTGIRKNEAIRIVYRFKRSVPKLTRWLADKAKEAVRTRTSYSADPYKRRRTMRDPEAWMLENIGKLKRAKKQNTFLSRSGGVFLVERKRGGKLPLFFIKIKTMMIRRFSIIETDNFGGDYPNESFVIRHLKKETAEAIADLINKDQHEFGDGPRYHKVVEDSYSKPYKLQPGFEP